MDFFQMFNERMRMGVSPEQVAQEMMAGSPEFRQFYEQMQNMSGGLSPKDFYYQYAKQNGVPKEQAMQVARMFNLK